MATLSPAIPPTIVYPDSDGQPMAENTVQYRYLTTIKGGLEIMFRDRDDIFVAGDLFWYPVEGHPEIRVAPDVLIALGRPRGDRMSYLQWHEGHSPPQVVFEIVSPSNRAGEMALFYNRYGVSEYYVYNPFTGELTGWLRGPAELVHVETMQGWTSPLLGVTFEIDGLHLRLFAPDGSPFVTYEELAAQHEQERQRNERLTAQLRKLGVDPEA